MSKISHKDTSPGEDNIKCSDLLKLDPECLALTAILNVCLTTGRISKSWKAAEVISLYQKGNITDPSNYRPIALLRTIYKILSVILAKRLIMQGGFIPGKKGCLENIFLLDDALLNAQIN